MKAKERIKRYGVLSYLKMRKIPVSAANIKYYTEKYEIAPIDKPVKYRRTFWDITMKKIDNIVAYGHVPSAAHADKDDSRDIWEAFGNAQYYAGGTGWTLLKAKRVGKIQYVYHEERVVYKGRAPTPKTELQIFKEKIRINLLKKGMTFKEISEVVP